MFDLLQTLPQFFVDGYSSLYRFAGPGNQITMEPQVLRGTVSNPAGQALFTDRLPKPFPHPHSQETNNNGHEKSWNLWYAH